MSIIYSLETAIEVGSTVRTAFEKRAETGEVLRYEYFAVPDDGVINRTILLDENSADKNDAVAKLICSLERLIDLPRTVVRYRVDTSYDTSVVSAGWSSPRNALRRLYELNAKG